MSRWSWSSPTSVGAEFDDARGVGLITNDDAKPVDGEDPYRVVGYFAEWSVYVRDYEVSQIGPTS